MAFDDDCALCADIIEQPEVWWSWGPFVVDENFFYALLVQGFFWLIALAAYKAARHRDFPSIPEDLL